MPQKPIRLSLPNQKNFLQPQKALIRSWCIKRIIAFGILALSISISIPASADNIDVYKRQAARAEKARDCEKAYKKYQNMKVAVQQLPSSNTRSGLLSFVATKLRKLQACYTKCTPTAQDLSNLSRIKRYEAQGQRKRAYRMLLRVTRGKSPRCASWKEAHALRRTLAARLPKRRSQRTVDPCDVDSNTRGQLSSLTSRVRALESQLASVQKKPTIPVAPAPPRWAKSKRKKRYWKRRWERRQRRSLRRKIDKIRVRRLRQTLSIYQEINSLREKAFSLREDFQDCDQLYTKLKSQSNTLRKSHDKTQEVIAGIYDSRIQDVKRKMYYYAGRYRRLRKQQKRDKSTIRSLKNALQQQRGMLDNVSQDLMTLSSLLVFKPSKNKEGSVLGDSLSNLQQMMTDQGKLLSEIKKNYPQYIQNEGGKNALRQHIASLERFEKVIERFQGKHTGVKAEKVEQTLEKVRASILLFEKAEESLPTASANAQNLQASKTGQLSSATVKTPVIAENNKSSSFSWGLILLLMGVLLGGGALFYLWRERQRQSFKNF